MQRHSNTENNNHKAPQSTLPSNNKAKESEPMHKSMYFNNHYEFFPCYSNEFQCRISQFILLFFIKIILLFTS